MEVAALLAPPLLFHLRNVLGPASRLHELAGWNELQRELRRKPVELIVVDPARGGGEAVTAIATILRDFPSVPVIAYTVLAPAALQRLVQLAGHGLRHVVLHRFDDEPRRFAALIDSLHGYDLGDRVLDQLDDRIAQLPTPTALVVRELFRNPGEFATPADVARAAGVTLRQLYRQVEQAGLAPAARLVQVAKLLRAYAYLRDPGSMVEDVAGKLGYAAPRVLSRQITMMTGVRASEWRSTMTPEKCMEMLAAAARGRMAPGVVGGGSEGSLK